MKAKASIIALAYDILNREEVKFTKLDTKEKIIIIKIMDKLKPVATYLNKFRLDALKKLKSEDFDEIAMKVQSRCSLTPAEMFSFKKVENALEECMQEESEKEHEIDFKPVSEAIFGKLLDSNDFTIGQAQLLMEVIG